MAKQKVLISIADATAAYMPVLEVELDAGKVKNLLKSLGAEANPEPETESETELETEPVPEE